MLCEHGECKDEIKYYITYKNGTPEEIKLKAKSILNAIPESKREAIAQYIKSNTGKIDELYLIDLFHTVNK